MTSLFERQNLGRDCLRITILILLYVLIGNARSIDINPFLPGAMVAVNMIVPVLGGILFGPRVGLMVGLFGTLFGALLWDAAGRSEAAQYEYLAIVPHAVMGYVAGYLRTKVPTVIVSSTLIIGHVLTIAMVVLFIDEIGTPLLGERLLWYSIGYDVFAGMIAVTILAMIYRIGTQAVRNT
jgi:LytS/YehU family sensor histidine kinase